ncbi:hypothetical protein BCR32DRAFT_252019 [Anaeromyces robustus]|uniref:Uncharacterized protein n=1 Tax=Anaeromyces robustus TaxID=1754192 RepID=A0A1Y1UTN1_9FUNG|nr:hypothetical protein BCR32DRAFT_252019 [Anaeromyces robustus]|eukprot:ORX41389.1 hypothetical protein BCR32DRAFT_252019 [Anaeromyces robustus]
MFPIKCNSGGCQGNIYRERIIKNGTNVKTYYTIRCNKCKGYVSAVGFKAYLIYLNLRGIVYLTGDNDTNFKIHFKDLVSGNVVASYKFFLEKDTLNMPNTPLFPSPGAKDKSIGS